MITKDQTLPAADQQVDLEELIAQQNMVSAVTQSMSNEFALLNQLLGQAQMAGAFEEFSRTVRTSKLAHVKETKLYRALAGKKSPHGAENLAGTWEEFCNLLGRSVDQIDRDIANLHAFGEEALDSMSKMGIGYRELRQYRKLPEDQKAALIEVAKTGDKESFVELAEEIITKHAKEKEQSTQKLEDLQANYTAQGEVMAKKSAELDAARQEIEAMRRRIQSKSADEAAAELRKEACEVAYSIEAGMGSGLRAAISLLTEQDDHEHRNYAAMMLRQLELTLKAIRNEFALPDNEELDEQPPAWQTEDPAALLARIGKQD